jgi:hypothetical protein
MPAVSVIPEPDYRVLAACWIGSVRLVIYDWMDFPPGQPARNLFAYHADGSLLWRAEDIGQGSVDAYVSILTEQPLRVWNFACFVCTIDINTGLVLEMTESR